MSRGLSPIAEGGTDPLAGSKPLLIRRRPREQLRKEDRTGASMPLCSDAHMLSYTALFVLQALAQGHKFGFDIMDATELPSGTVYPALRRLEAAGLVESAWEEDARSRKAGRPRRRYYQLTKRGRDQLSEAEARYRAVSKLFEKRSRA